jgi:hypothetical protein
LGINDVDEFLLLAPADEICVVTAFRKVFHVSDNDHSSPALAHGSQQFPETQIFQIASEHQNAELTPEVDRATHDSAEIVHVFVE